MTIKYLTALCALLPLTAVAADEAAPRSLDPRIKIELFAEHPQIVTPTGIDVDQQGRVWALESNTHFRPEDYQGHPSDRLLVLTDTTGDGRADSIVTFADGFVHAMSVAVRPVWLPTVESLHVYVATRDAVWLLEDTTGDLQADRRTRLVHLDTPGKYSHNGLAGFAFDAMGWMYFGFGENLGAKYTIKGADGTTLSGGGEGGNLYRCRPDGTKLSLWATGFWNPHASCVDTFGRLFTVDNDPDSRPPCRLLHIIKGGDYGYRFRNGRRGLHPFTSWNGEIPGTLPMVAGTGEAPSGIVAYESDGLPDEYRGDLLVTSWGDHRIDRFRLEPKGASFTSRAEPLITGGQNFRPVGLATAPDGSLYCTDWVLRDYKLHGKGRIWRIALVEEPRRNEIELAELTKDRPADELVQRLRSQRLDVRRTAAQALRETKDGRQRLLSVVGDFEIPARARVESLWSLAQVPVSVENFRFMDRSESPAQIAGMLDEVGVAAYELLGTPQFPVGRNPEFLHGRAQHFLIEPPQPSDSVSMFQLTFHELRWAHRNKFGGLIYYAAIQSGDPFLLSRTVHIFGAGNAARSPEWLKDALESTESYADMPLRENLPAAGRGWCRTAWLLAVRKASPKAADLAAIGLQDPWPQVRRAAVQWVAEEDLKDLRPRVEQVLDSEPLTPDLLMATLAALSMLDGVPPAEFEKSPPTELLLPIVRDARRPAALRATVLRTLPAEAQGLDAELLGELLKSETQELQLEAVRTLQQTRIPGREDLLQPLVSDERQEVPLRAEAVVALADADPDRPLSDATVQLLRELVEGEDKALSAESLRTLRGVVADRAEEREKFSLVFQKVGESDQKPGVDEQEWNAQVDLLFGRTIPWNTADIPEGGDPEAGRRIFFHPHSTGCFKCHTVHGRGGKVGPDLSVVARSMDRKKLAESILEPSREISPQYVGWTFVMKSGRVHTGLVVGEGPGDRIHIGAADGTVQTIQREEIEEWQPSRTSIMPEKLHERLTPGEFRDLLAFLETLK